MTWCIDNHNMAWLALCTHLNGNHDVARRLPQHCGCCSSSPWFLGCLPYLSILIQGLGLLHQPPSLHLKTLASMHDWKLVCLFEELALEFWWSLKKEEVHIGARKQRASLDPSPSSYFWVTEGIKFIPWNLIFLFQVWVHFWMILVPSIDAHGVRGTLELVVALKWSLGS